MTLVWKVNGAWCGWKRQCSSEGCSSDSYKSVSERTYDLIYYVISSIYEQQQVKVFHQQKKTGGHSPDPVLMSLCSTAKFNILNYWNSRWRQKTSLYKASAEVVCIWTQSYSFNWHQWSTLCVMGENSPSTTTRNYTFIPGKSLCNHFQCLQICVGVFCQLNGRIATQNNYTQYASGYISLYSQAPPLPPHMPVEWTTPGGRSTHVPSVCDWSSHCRYPNPLHPDLDLSTCFLLPHCFWG